GFAWESVDIPKTADPFTHRGKPGSGGIGTGLAIPGDAGINQARVGLLQLLRSQAPLFQGARAKIFDEDIDAVCQLPGDVSTLVSVQIKRNTLLIAAQAAPPERRAMLENAPHPQGIPFLWRLDLDDFGAKVGQDTASKR